MPFDFAQGLKIRRLKSSKNYVMQAVIDDHWYAFDGLDLWRYLLYRAAVLDTIFAASAKIFQGAYNLIFSFI